MPALIISTVSPVITFKPYPTPVIIFSDITSIPYVRISASLVVGDRDDGTGDLFERSDAYYVYLRDPRLTEDAIRAANGWGLKAAVPLWIPMPAH